jgi:dTDP-4-dehydrorhamnose reductase
MVVLVTGSQGQLGQAIQKLAPELSTFEFVFTDSNALNITDSKAIESAFKKHQPDFCINAAAYTAVDLAESEKDKTFEINEKAVHNLALACANHQAVLLHVSTDFVFDGTNQSPYLETNTTNPISVYGASKLAGELVIPKVLKEYFIIRTSWVFSENGKNFLNTMLRLADQKTEISVVNDQKGCPTHALDLAKALLLMIEKTANQSVQNAFGIYHFSNKNETTWFEFAQKIMEVYEKNCLVHPIPTSSYPTPAQRPKYSVMNTSKFEKTFEFEIQPWTKALLNYRNLGFNKILINQHKI